MQRAVHVEPYAGAGFRPGARLHQSAGGHRSGGDYEVDRNRRTVSVGMAGGAPIMRSAFREGLGCVALAPDQTFEAIDSLPARDASAVRRPGHDAVA